MCLKRLGVGGDRLGVKVGGIFSPVLGVGNVAEIEECPFVVGVGGCVTFKARLSGLQVVLGNSGFGRKYLLICRLLGLGRGLSRRSGLAGRRA